MRYSEVINFEPITTVIQLVRASDKKFAETYVKNFVFSKKMKEDISEIIIKNLDTEPEHETRGIQIVGSYGTGKSHLMSLVSCIAENSEFLQLLSSPEMIDQFKKIAGKYKVLKFEIGVDRPLKDVVFAQIERFLDTLGISYTFDENSNFSWKESIQDMMSVFEENFPDHFLLIVMDEVLEYLKGRKPDRLSNDLMFLRQFGESCNNSRFRVMFGVQELLYRSPEFQFQAQMLNKIQDRYSDLIITKEDVAFVVKERLLKKDNHQKDLIRKHLLKFAHLFDCINTDLNEFVDLFPVHRSFISAFENIKHGKSQREILKVLSSRFDKIKDEEIPEDKPGLITYDTYWVEIENDSAMMSIPDIREVKEKTEIIYERINGYFDRGRTNRKEMAFKITHALAIRVLFDDLKKQIGDNAANLKEDLCTTIAGVNDPELLLENVESTANLLVKATSGQYIDKNEINGDFYLRSEGGINVIQLIRDYADEIIKKSSDVADKYFFDILQYILEIKQDSYRSGFKIWQHSLEWTSKKSFRLGYIFFGNPNERSTTEPIQQYYIFFCPLFNSINRNDESDEVYFDFSGLSDEFKDVVYRYGAAKAKHISASSNHKKLFEEQIDDLLSIAIKLFDKEYIDKTNVIYKGETKPLKSYPLLSEGSSKEMIFYKLSANLLNNCFNDKYPDYPAFTNLNQALTKENFEERVKSALRKIVSPDKENRDGEAVLNGLGLYNGQYIDIQNSKYADSIISLFKNSSTETVINRSDILYPHYADANLWYSIEYNIEYQLVFIVLTALVFKGEIEIFWSPNKVLSATNIDTVTNFNNEDYFTFQHIKKPKGLPVKSLKALFTCLNLPDYSLELDKPQTISSIVSKAKEMVEKVVTTINLINNGISCKDVPLLNIQEKTEKKDKLDELKTMLDNIQSYNTSGKLKLFKYTEEELLATFEAYKYCYEIDKLKEKKDRFEKLITYLLTAKAFIEEDSALLKNIEDEINKLGDHLLNSSESELKKYETRLNALKDKYATYYMDKYVKYRMSTKDANIKEKLMKSDDKKVWDNLKDIGILNSLDYNKIIDNIRSLKVADPNLRKQNILEDPYFDFNPRDYKDKIAYRISDLEEELEKIYDKWTKAVKSFLKDPSVKDNIDILPEKDKKIIETLSQQDAHIDLSMSERLKHIIPQLSEGIDKIEISMEKFKNEIDKPVTPEEAIDFFTKYIDSLCSGKERKKIRIIIK